MTQWAEPRAFFENIIDEKECACLQQDGAAARHTD